jgi:hypothetical protein
MAITSHSKMYSTGAITSAMPTTSQSVGSRFMAFPLCGQTANAVVSVTVVTGKGDAGQCCAWCAVVHAVFAASVADHAIHAIGCVSPSSGFGVVADFVDVSTKAVVNNCDFIGEPKPAANFICDAGQNWRSELAVHKDKVSAEPNSLAVKGVVVAALVVGHAVKVSALESLGDRFNLATARAIDVRHVDAGAASVHAGLDAELDARECFFEGSANEFCSVSAREVCSHHNFLFKDPVQCVRA